MSEEKVEIINSPNAVKAKVRIGGPGAVDAVALERAEQAIAAMGDQYLDWVQEDLAKIDAAYKDLSASGSDAEELDRVFQVAHDMKGQGGSFGFDLITAIGDQLCRMIEKMDGEAGSAEINAIGVHIDAMKMVIAQDMKGDGGEAGDQILDGLEKVMEKVLG